MSQLIKIADWDGGTRVNVVFVHGLGGHAYDTFRRNKKDTFWPVWLAQDIPGLSAWTLAYDAPKTNWLGTAMPLQDRAKNVLESLLGASELRGLPLIFVCHSLGGLVVKQVLRAADARRAYDEDTNTLLISIQGVVFLATPHTGSMQATWLDRLRLLAWPSASVLDLVKNNPNLRDLNVWYRNWAGPIHHKVFTETHGTSAGIIVEQDSGDPGLLHVEPVAIDADHINICKPSARNDLVYARTRDFICDKVLKGSVRAGPFGAVQIRDLAPLPKSRAYRLLPFVLRLAFLFLLSLVVFKGVQTLVFPQEILNSATIEQIEAAVKEKSPKLTASQIEQFITALKDLEGNPSFGQAVEEARKGNTRVAEGIWRQIIDNEEKAETKARQNRAEAMRNLAASVVTSNVLEGLSWYRKAVALDPGNIQGQLGLGDAAMAAGATAEAGQAFRQLIELARRASDEPALEMADQRLGDVQVAQGNLTGALKSYREDLAIAGRLARSDEGNADWQRDLSVSYEKIGDVQVAQGDLPSALKSYQDGLAIRERLARSDEGNAGWQRDLSVSNERLGDVFLAQGNLAAALEQYQFSLKRMVPIRDSDPSNADLQRFTSVTLNKIGDVQVAQGDLASALKSYQDGLAIAERLARSDEGNAGWQRDLSISYNKIGDVQVAQGDLAGALQSYRDGLAIRERLARSDDGNAGWQRDLSVSYDRIGDVQVAQGDLPGALKSYRDALAIAERLARSGEGNAGWQRDVAVSYAKLADVHQQLDDTAKALDYLRQGQTIMTRLTKLSPENAIWARDLAWLNSRIAELGSKAG